MDSLDVVVSLIAKDAMALAVALYAIVRMAEGLKACRESQERMLSAVLELLRERVSQDDKRR